MPGATGIGFNPKPAVGSPNAVPIPIAGFRLKTLLRYAYLEHQLGMDTSRHRTAIAGSGGPVCRVPALLAPTVMDLPDIDGWEAMIIPIP
jgi:hypothetical protein